MPLKNFDFPKVVLKQQFAEVPSGVGSTLGVACIGPLYIAYGGDHLCPLKQYVDDKETNWYNYSTSAGFSGELKNDGVAAGAVEYYALNPIVSYIDFDSSTADEGSYTEYDDSYLNSTGLGLTVLPTAAGTNSIKLNLSFAEYGSYPAHVIDIFRQHRPEPGAMVGFAGTTGIDWRNVTGVSESGDGYYTISFDGSALTADKTRYYLGYRYDGYVKLDSTGFTRTGTAKAVSVAAGTRLAVADEPTSFVDNCPLFAAYRVRKTVDSFSLMTFESLADIESKLGPVCADNPLALGCYCALMGGNGTVVYAVPVKEDTGLGYQSAIDFLDKYEDIYSIVPCVSSNEEGSASIVMACVTACKSSSADEEHPLRRVCWYGIDNPTSQEHKDDTADELVDVIVDLRKERSSTERAVCVWSDDPILNGEHISNFAVAAAAAGMRAYEPAHRPLSNLGYSFLQLGEGKGFTRSNLKKIASNGIWVVANNNDGLPINKRQLTTAVANNLNLDEESIISNTDNIAMTVHQVGKNWVGCSNISPAMLVLLRDSLQQILDYFQLNLTEDPMVGPPLLSAEIIKLYQDPVQKDRVYAVFNCEPPKPFNEFQMTMRVL